MLRGWQKSWGILPEMGKDSAQRNARSNVSILRAGKEMKHIVQMTVLVESVQYLMTVVQDVNNKHPFLRLRLIVSYIMAFQGFLLHHSYFLFYIGLNTHRMFY
ncbi:unnamed protein product [Heterobilharzia americana]|nr:unnamed protein product [Heterobilharzia americana]